MSAPPPLIGVLPVEVREPEHLMTSTSPRYDDLSALFINCTLKPSP